jgi:CBS domain-containing protein
MTKNPVACDATDTARTAATAMRERDTGAVIVQKDGKVCGIVTDRDIVVRAVAEGRSPDQVKLADIASKDLTFLSPSDPVDKAVQMMREKSVRRLPVLDKGKPVGVVSIGDLAMERDGSSVLADISAAPGNH